MKKRKKTSKKAFKNKAKKVPYTYIPGIDPEIQLHDPEFIEPTRMEPERVNVADIRDVIAPFGEEQEQRVLIFPKQIKGAWYRYHTQNCSVKNVIFDGRYKHLYMNGSPVMGLGRRLAPTMGAVQASYEGKVVLPEPVTHYSGKSILLVGHSWVNYWHFITEVLSELESLYHLIEKENIERIILGSCPERFITFQKELINLLYPEIADLFIFEDRSFSADHIYYTANYYNTRKRLSEGADTSTGAVLEPNIKYPGGNLAFMNVGRLFDRAERQLGTTPKSEQKEIIFVSRKAATGRKIINEDHVMERLAPLGVRRLSMEQLTVREQLELMARTKLLIGPHGAGMTNAGFMQSGAQAIEITARNYLQRAKDFAQYSMMRDLQYDFLVCDEYGDIVNMRNNKGNDLLLSERAIDYLSQRVLEASAQP